MGRRPKATVSRINNLRHPRKILRAPVEDIQTDLEDLDFNGNPPHNHAIDSEDEIDNEEIEDESMDKPVTDADIVAFTQILAEAQLAAVKAERTVATADKPNRKRHYIGNSKRTKRYHD